MLLHVYTLLHILWLVYYHEEVVVVLGTIQI